ncbi:MAG: S-layer homology domain-containing protein [Clostridiales Family XIII bacterium]|jgi:hypothetical protein|nr:S-layer homology domain-containing protein [Clostridiales Family XIII bacterium]
MQRPKRQLLSGVLVLAMLFTTVPTVAAAASSSGEVKLYEDAAGTIPATGVGVALTDAAGTDKTITLTFDAVPAANDVYWLSVDGSAVTPVYVTAESGTPPVKTLPLNGSEPISLARFAPLNSGVADKVTIAGYQNLKQAEDFADYDAAYASFKDAVNWYLSAGFTNGGDSLRNFGYARDHFYRHELALIVYRLFGIVEDADFLAYSFADVVNFTDKYCDAVANLAAVGALADLKDVTSAPGEPGTFHPEYEVTWEDLLVLTYNAFKSPSSMLTDAGKVQANAIANATGATDKAAAVIAAFGLGTITTSDTLTKLGIVQYFYRIFGGTPLTKQKTYPDAAFAETTHGDPSNGNNREQYLDPVIRIDRDNAVDYDNSVGKRFVYESAKDDDGLGVALYVTDGANVTLKNPYIGSDAPSPITENALQLPTGPFDPLAYRFGVNANAIATGEGTVLNLVSDDGGLVLEARGDSMAGGLYTTAGSAINVKNAHIYSGGQHTSNITYNGTLRYDDSTILGAGRIFSSDFWSGDIVYKNSISYKNAGGMSGAGIIDESNSVFVLNSYTYGDSAYNLHGYGTLYYENSYVDTKASLNIMNNTSMLSDTAYLALDNTVYNVTGNVFAEVSRAGKAVAYINDSAITTASGPAVAMANMGSVNGNLPVGNDGLFDPDGLFRGGMELHVYGDTTFNGKSNALFVEVGYGYDLIVYTDNDNLAVYNIISKDPDFGVKGVGNVSVIKNGGSPEIVSAETLPNEPNYDEEANSVGGGGAPGGDSVTPTAKSLIGNMPILSTGVAALSGNTAAFTLKGFYSYDANGNYAGIAPYSVASATSPVGGAGAVIPESKAEEEEEATDSPAGAIASLPFSDVTAANWFYDAVKYVYDKGLFTGVSSGTFSPDTSMNRAMMVTVLYRLAGSPAADTDGAFNDVTDGSWYAEAVNWAANSGVASGYGDGRFGPLDNITREQLAAMLLRFAGLTGSAAQVNADLDRFDDAADISPWATDAMRWAVGTGLIQGTDAGLLNPRREATRAELATIVARYCELIE